MVEVSVLLATYNRACRLSTAVAALLDQIGNVDFEVIVIDNNSTDDTAAVVARMAATSARIRYVFEPRQGKSHALNTGLALARGAILAFTDDDVRVAPDWVLQFHRSYGMHPDVDYIGGRVLPEWPAPPPKWLTTAHWSPLALQDYGDDLQTVGPHRAVCLIGANIAYRRHVFERVGGFTPALGRTGDGIGSTEDHDLQLRMWRAGLRGLYDPSIVVHAEVTPDRLTREYHQRWHRGHGHHCALMRLRELVPADLGPMSEPAGIVTLFGTPAFVYLEVPHNAYQWLRSVALRKDPLFYAHQLRHVLSYIRTSYHRFRREGHPNAAVELRRFARSYLRKRCRSGAGPQDRSSGPSFAELSREHDGKYR
jgi:glycosyltransferase involved in cell wall biosynthesis